MAGVVGAASVAPVPAAPVPAAKRVRGGWALEALGLTAAYLLYDWARDQVQGSGAIALRNARSIVRVGAAPRALPGAPDPAVVHRHSTGSSRSGTSTTGRSTSWRRSSRSSGSTARHRSRYVRWRNTLLLMLAIGLLGFWLYPLMPPRLMPARYGFVDTARGVLQLRPAAASGPRPDGTADRRRAVARRSGTCSRRCRACTSDGRPGPCSRCCRTIRRRWVRVLLCSTRCARCSRSR